MTILEVVNPQSPERWNELAKLPGSPWEGRLRLIAARIPEGSTVIDVGAGSMALRGILPAGCLYLPVDCVEGAPIWVSLDDHYAPHLNGDVVVMSGVLEYQGHPAGALDLVASWAPCILVSYDHGGTRESRAASGWQNHLSCEEFVTLCSKLKPHADGRSDNVLTVEKFGEWEGQTLYELRRA